MGWLSGDKLEISTSTASSSPTGWVPQGYRQNYLMAREVANRPYEAYTGQRVAGLTQDQIAANNMLRGQMDDWEPYLNDAAATYRQNMRPQGQGVQDYMNPYAQTVVRDTMNALNRQRQVTNQTNAADAIRASAFGGSRHGVVDALSNEAFYRQSGELANRMNVQNFAQAQTAFDADRERTMNAATNLANLGQMGQSLGLRDIAALQGIGGQQQALNQAQNDVRFANYMDRRNYPLTQLNILGNALSGAPFSVQNTESVPAGYSSTGLAAALGNAASTLGTLSQAGGLLSDIGGLIFGTPNDAGGRTGGFFDWLGRQFS